jgi:hypothetical protein
VEGGYGGLHLPGTAIASWGATDYPYAGHVDPGDGPR